VHHNGMVVSALCRSSGGGPTRTSSAGLVGDDSTMSFFLSFFFKVFLANERNEGRCVCCSLQRYMGRGGVIKDW